MVRMPHPRTMFGGNRSGGFTLVELAMASFLVAIGLLAVFALLRRGIDTEGFSEDEVRETLFAETAFATLRAASDHASATNGWNAFWENFEAGNTKLPLPGAFHETPPPEEANDPAPFLLGCPNEEWRTALFSGWPTDNGLMAVSNTVWYTVAIMRDDEDPYAHVQIHIRGTKPGNSSRTAFTIIPKQTGRAFREANQRTSISKIEMP